jgi:hypothetical protein
LDSSLVLLRLKSRFLPRAFIPAPPSTGISYSTPRSARRLPPSIFPPPLLIYVREPVL